MTIHKTREIYIRHSRVPLPEVYSSLSEAFHKAYADETEIPGVEAVSGLGGVEVCWIAVLPDPSNLGSWPVSGETVVALPLQIRGLETIPRTRCNGRGPDSSLKGLRIFV